MSDKAKERGIPQLGSLGSGNHFLELDIVDEIFDEDTAGIFGLEKDCHGDGALRLRGCGHQIATDYIQRMERYVRKHNISLPDPQLACAPWIPRRGGLLRSHVLRRQLCLGEPADDNALGRESFGRFSDASTGDLGMRMVYDVAHNIAKKERHKVDGRETEVLVHRKGATGLPRRAS